MADELLPCPLCGGRAVTGKWFVIDGSGRPDMWRARCVFGCVHGADQLTEGNSISTWNKRPAQSAETRLAALREGMEGVLAQIERKAARAKWAGEHHEKRDQDELATEKYARAGAFADAAARIRAVLEGK